MSDKIIDGLCFAGCTLVECLSAFMEMTMILWIALLPIALSITTGKSWYLMLLLTPYAVNAGIYNLYTADGCDADDDSWLALSNVSDVLHFILECVLLIVLAR